MSNFLRNAMCITKVCPLLSVAAMAAAGAAPVDTSTIAPDAHLAACASEYSIINLGPAATRAVGNERGAFALTVPDLDAAGKAVLRLLTFDGQRFRDRGTYGDDALRLAGMNAHGTVIGQIALPSDPLHTRGFSWTAASGMRLLPGPGPSVASAINDRNQVVGSLNVSDNAVRAVLWNPGGSRVFLGPQTGNHSLAHAVNRSGMSAGFANSLEGITRAMVWDSAGRATDLGLPPAGSSAVAYSINSRGEVAGALDIVMQRVGFYWSRERGMVLIRAPGGASLNVRALNERGDIAGQIVTSPGLSLSTPFLWSLRNGLSPLPISGAASGTLNGLNNRRQMVGHLQPSRTDAASRRAVVWSGAASPVDLNTRLCRAPAGLVLTSATAVNDQGEILADSNAGLLLLRPGRQGTAAPVLGPITGLPPYAQIPLGSTLDLAAGFVDSAARETHVATARITDGCPQTAPTVREARGAGEVNLRHIFCRSGNFTIRVTLKDSAGNSTDVSAEIFVTDPGLGALPGQGT